MSAVTFGALAFTVIMALGLLAWAYADRVMDWIRERERVGARARTQGIKSTVMAEVNASRPVQRSKAKRHVQQRHRRRS